MTCSDPGSARAFGSQIPHRPVDSKPGCALASISLTIGPAAPFPAQIMSAVSPAASAWSTAAPCEHAEHANDANDANDANGASARPFVWMYWSQGEAHLASLSHDAPLKHAQGAAPSKYARDARCVRAWRRLNPQYAVRLLDNETAAALSPAFAGIPWPLRGRTVASDVLRFDLLSRYGGVWADVSACPVQPLGEWLPALLRPAGIFAFTVPMDLPAGVANVTLHRDCLTNRLSAGPERALDPSGHLSRSKALWLVATSGPAHPAIIRVRDALLAHVLALAPSAVCQGWVVREGLLPNPCPTDGVRSAGDYIYFLVQCLVTRLTLTEVAVGDAMRAIPQLDMEQHGGNAVTETHHPADTTVDPQKYMYKGGAAPGGHSRISDAEYERWVATAEAQMRRR